MNKPCARNVALVMVVVSTALMTLGSAASLAATSVINSYDAFAVYPPPKSDQQITFDRDFRVIWSSENGLGAEHITYHAPNLPHAKDISGGKYGGTFTFSSSSNSTYPERGGPGTHYRFRIAFLDSKTDEELQAVSIADSGWLPNVDGSKTSAPVLPTRVLPPHVTTRIETDDALDEIVTLTPSERTYADLRNLVQTKTGRVLGTGPDDTELDKSFIHVAGRRVTVRALMDALAARYENRWEFVPGSSSIPAQYLLLNPVRELEEVFTPKTEARRERLKVTTKFFEAVEKLPKSLREDLLGNKPFFVRTLPESLQKPIVDMLEVAANERTARGREPSPLVKQLGTTAQMKVEVEPSRGFDRRNVKFFARGVGQSQWSWDNYEAKRYEQEAKRLAAGKRGEPWHQFDPRLNRIPNNAAKALPDLKRTVSIAVPDATFPAVLAFMHKRYGIPYVSDTLQNMPQTANISLGPMPLGAALDRLTEIFNDTEWEWRKQGFLVVRGPGNSAKPRIPGPLPGDP